MDAHLQKSMPPSVSDTCKCCTLANSMPQPAGRLSVPVPVDCLHGNCSITAFRVPNYQPICYFVLL